MNVQEKASQMQLSVLMGEMATMRRELAAMKTQLASVSVEKTRVAPTPVGDYRRAPTPATKEEEIGGPQKLDDVVGSAGGTTDTTIEFKEGEADQDGEAAGEMSARIETAKERRSASMFTLRTWGTDKDKDAADVAKVRRYMEQEMRFESQLIDDGFIEIFLKKRWINKASYTFDGGEEIFTEEFFKEQGVEKEADSNHSWNCPAFDDPQVDEQGNEVGQPKGAPKNLSELLAEPVEFIKTLRFAGLDSYAEGCEHLIEDMDIYQLPSLKMKNIAFTNLHLLDDLLKDVNQAFGQGGEQTDEQIEKTFRKIDTDGSNGIDIDEFTVACQLLQEEGINLDKNGNGSIVEEVLALFQIIDRDQSGEINLEEFTEFVRKTKAGESVVKGNQYAVWEGKTAFLFAYFCYAMSMILQFGTPIAVFSLFSKGLLANMPDMCANYPLAYECEAEIGEDEWRKNNMLYTDQIPETVYLMIQKQGWATAFCPSVFLQTWNATDATSASFLPRTSAFFLFLYLMVSASANGIQDKLDGCKGEYPSGPDLKDRTYDILKYSYMTQDLFYYHISFPINMWCYVIIVICTYMLFIAAPTAEDLLLNVIALQFLIDVDDDGFNASVNDDAKEQLKQKFVLSYIQNGEKSQDEVEKDVGGFSPAKVIGGVLCGSISAYIAVGFYWFGWALPFLLSYCMV